MTNGDRLKGKSAIVTGASRGIGAAIAKSFVLNGADVLVNYNTSEEEAKNLADSLRNSSNGRVVLFKANVADRDQRKTMISTALREFGKIDVLVNNAGVLSRSPFVEATEDEFDRIIDVNLKAPYFLCQEAAKVMLEQKRGKIINISSVSGLAQHSGLTQVDYVASKAGLIGLTRALAVNLGPYINVNAIAPGTIETEMIAALTNEAKDTMGSESLLRRLGRPEEIAGAAVFLASEESNFITGEVLTVAGGRGMR
jgi:3-oxoacyl-[acyl-carrier protein] reductase